MFSWWWWNIYILRCTKWYVTIQVSIIDFKEFIQQVIYKELTIQIQYSKNLLSNLQHKDCALPDCVAFFKTYEKRNPFGRRYYCKPCGNRDAELRLVQETFPEHNIFGSFKHRSVTSSKSSCSSSNFSISLQSFASWYNNRCNYQTSDSIKNQELIFWVTSDSDSLFFFKSFISQK